MALPPGGRTKAHVHEHHETALYMMSGDVLELWTGDELEHCETVRPGDFVYIPANVLHVAVNRGATPAIFIGSRNEATARESMCCTPRWTRGCHNSASDLCGPLQSRSAKGQSRRFGDVRATSALPLIADVRCEDQQVRKVPTKRLA